MVTHTTTKAHAAAHAGQGPNLENPLLGPHTPEEYEALEAASPLRHEYHHGQVWAMAGASINHVRVVRNFIASLDQQLASSDCEVLMNDIKYAAGGMKSYFYPDIMISCEKSDLYENSNIRCPKLIAEVLSDSTLKHDYNIKLGTYMQNDCVKYILYISQDEMHVWLYERKAEWVAKEFSKPTDTIPLPELNASISLADLYTKVVFKAPGPDVGA